MSNQKPPSQRFSKPRDWIKWRDVNGCRIRLRVVPPAPVAVSDSPTLPLVLLHGLGCSSNAWLPSLHGVAECRLSQAVLAPDLPGYGRSETPTRDALNMEELAEWTMRLLDLYEIPRAHLVGNSMGCQVAMCIARRWPDRVGGMVLQGPTVGKRIIPVWRYIVGLMADSVAESPIYNLVLIRMYAQMGIPRYLQTVKYMLADDPLAHAAQTVAPTLIVRGGFDLIIPESAARQIAVILPDAQYMPLDHTAHAIEFTTPELFVPAMVNFLYRSEARLNPPMSPPKREDIEDI